MQTTQIDESAQNETTASRRGVLKSVAGVATAATVGAVAIDGTHATEVTEPADYIPTTPAEIRAAFADVPYNEDPGELERAVAPMRFPQSTIPEDGSVPDPKDRIEVEVEPAPWALATTYGKMRHIKQRGAEPDRQNVIDHLIEVAYAHEEWVLPDGSDAVDAILVAVEENAP